ncbi:hypothetical protein BCR39DRAFT_511403 [Naematelia encephala]|uniref:Uncharacterized protein n=1 Tax=Naematelia encephala TaxID=71784 RepID=A0A1Y2BLN0_9TREE|nr:hypothetical protein BCR39DRAFT_511403 [Naematelia encephala]
MSTSNIASALPTSHPLITELTSLRQQLLQYQKAAHQSNIQLQGSRLELSLVKEENAVLRDQGDSLRKELEILRKNPAPPPIPPTSTALSELSLAHRRLSAKLDLTESQLASAQLELAAVKQEAQRLSKERDGQRATINELRRVEEDREEEIEWEKGERRRVEEQKKLVDLALQEYEALVHSIDPSVVPPAIPSKSSMTDILQSTPELGSPSLPTPPLVSPSGTSIHTASESISNLLVGQRGVHRLFTDFTSTLADKERKLHALQSRIDELEYSLSTVEDQLAAETALRVSAQDERDRALRDDASAAKVVERYMTFTQKTHATVHMHLDNLRARSAATHATLRNEVLALRGQLRGETERATRLREAMDEMSETLAREAVGRRREVAMRLKMMSLEEKKERKVETWLDKVRRARAGAEGAVLEPDALEVLLDEGVEAVTTEDKVVGNDKSRSWNLLGKKKKVQEASVAAQNEQSSVARVLLAEDLVNTLVQDLQIETERRIELERQRVDWLAKEAVEGVEPEADGEAHMMVFDMGEHDEEEEDVNPDKVNGGDDVVQEQSANDEPPTQEAEPQVQTTPSPEPQEHPLVGQLRDLFAPLQEKSVPLQKALHDLSLSLASLRSSLPVPVEAPDSPNASSSNRRKPFMNISLKSPEANSDPILLSLLDAIHEVIEDARVDVEIAVADEERVFRGFEALLGVGSSGAVQGKQVVQDAREYLEDRTEHGPYPKLESKVADVERDLAIIKRTLHETTEGMEMDKDKESGNDRTNKRGSIWTSVKLSTVSTPTTRSLVNSSSPPESPVSENRRRTTSLFAGVGSAGRTFSASVIGAPRRAVTGGFTGGLYRGRKASVGVGKKKEGDKKSDEVRLVNDQLEDDVE